VPQLATRLQGDVDRWGVSLITGLVRPPVGRKAGRYRSSVEWLEPGGGVAAAIDKVRAIPLLESSRSVPGEALLAASFGQATRWPKVEEAPAATALRGRFTVTPVLCYEVLFPRLVVHRRTPDSLAILNLADDSWVEGDTATRQLTTWAAFRAIEQRLTLIRVAHGGLSTVIDEFGRTLMTLPLDRFAHATVRVRSSPPPSAVEKAAIFAVPFLTALVVGWGLRLARPGGSA